MYLVGMLNVEKLGELRASIVQHKWDEEQVIAYMTQIAGFHSFPRAQAKREIAKAHAENTDRMRAVETERKIALGGFLSIDEAIMETTERLRGDDVDPCRAAKALKDLKDAVLGMDKVRIAAKDAATRRAVANAEIKMRQDRAKDLEEYDSGRFDRVFGVYSDDV